METGVATAETLWWFLKKLHKLPHDPVIPLPDTSIHRDSNRNIPHVHNSITCKSQKVEATQVSTNGWVDKQKVVCTYTHTIIKIWQLLSFNKEEHSGTC